MVKAAESSGDSQKFHHRENSRTLNRLTNLREIARLFWSNGQCFDYASRPAAPKGVDALVGQDVSGPVIVHILLNIFTPRSAVVPISQGNRPVLSDRSARY